MGGTCAGLMRGETMSSYYRYHLFCDLAVDAPQTLHRALTALSQGAPLTLQDMADLPPIVAEYLTNSGFPGDGVHLYAPHGPGRLLDGRAEIDLTSAHARYSLSLTRTFHDDEYYNGGIYYPYWLMQFLADDGPIGTRQQTNGREPPGILTRIGGDIILSQAAYAPAEFWPIPGQALPDRDVPMVFRSHDRFNLTQRLEDLAMFSGAQGG
jgi:hypothetical protein